MGQSAEKALGKERWKAALFYLLSPQMSGAHFQGGLSSLFLKKDLIVERPLPSGLGISLGPAGKSRVLMSWAVEEAQHWQGYWEKVLLDGLLPPESALGSGRGLGSDVWGPVHESVFQRDALLSGHLLAVSPNALGMGPGVLAPQRGSSC